MYWFDGKEQKGEKMGRSQQCGPMKPKLTARSAVIRIDKGNFDSEKQVRGTALILTDTRMQKDGDNVSSAWRGLQQ